MRKVKVVSVEAGGYFTSEYTSGSTVNVTLQRGQDFASCDGILIFESEQVDNDLFDEWVAAAMEGEEGYTAMVVEGGKTVMYA
jgi:hypothetical protein